MTKAPHTPKPSEKSPSEMVESLTGFDEIAIEKAFDFDVYADAEGKPMLLLRALVFVECRRDGLNDKDAKDAALSVPMGDLTGLFAPEEDGEPGEGSASSD